MKHCQMMSLSHKFMPEIDKINYSARFKTLRHIETVRNYLNMIIRELLYRGEQHDKSKLEAPEVELFDLYTDDLKNLTYGSKEYNESLNKSKFGEAINRHYLYNRHHPEFFPDGIFDMNLIDILEMICDWYAATFRHKDGDIYRSLEINQKKFGYSDELKRIIQNTIDWLKKEKVYHKANES